MKTSNAVRKIGALVAAGGLVAAFAGPALAAGGPSPVPPPGASANASRMSLLQAACEKAVSNRLTSITAARTAVQANAHLTASDRTTLLTQLGDESTGLGALGSKIAGDTTLTTLRTDCRNIVAEYHWYVIGEPKVHLTIAADDATAIVQKLNDLSTRLQADIDRAKQHGKDTTQAQADLNAFNAAVTAGLNAASPVPAMVLPLGFANWAAAQPVLQQARTDLGNARDDLRTARADAAKVLSDLKALAPPKAQEPTATATTS